MSKNAIRDTYFSDEGKSSFYEIVSNNLFVGMELANYDSLCRVLNIEKIPSFGKPRLRHNAAFNCFFEFYRVENTNRIRIDKIYPFNEIKEYECPTSGNFTKEEKPRERVYYLDYMMPLLQDYVAVKHRGVKTIAFTMSDIMEYLGFANNNFVRLSNSLQKMYITKDYDSTKITVYKIISSRCFSEILKKQLATLKKKNYIKSFSNEYFIERKKDGTITKATDTDLQIIIDLKEKYKECEEYHIHWNDSINNRHISYLINKELSKPDYDFTIKGMKWVIEFTDSFTPHRLSEKAYNDYKEKLNDKVLKRVINKAETEAASIYNRMNKADPNDSDSEKTLETKRAYYITQYHMIGNSLENLKQKLVTESLKCVKLELDGPHATSEEYDSMNDEIS